MDDLLAITLGNTSVAMAPVADDGSLGDVRQEPLARLKPLFKKMVPTPGERDAPIIVASVNSPALERLRDVAPGKGPAAPKAARDDFPIPIPTDVDKPEKVGVDRLLAALAAYRRAGGPCVVVDCGTAVTVDAVAADGTFLGGAIFPGLDMMARALADGAAQLPQVEIGPAESVIGKNTEDAIRAGILHGTAGALTALISAAHKVVGPDARVFVTGGDAASADGPVVSEGPMVVPNLVLEGLVAAYRDWQKR